MANCIHPRSDEEDAEVFNAFVEAARTGDLVELLADGSSKSLPPMPNL